MRAAASLAFALLLAIGHDARGDGTAGGAGSGEHSGCDVPPPATAPVAAAPVPPFAGPAFDEGNRLFDEAIRYVTQGRAAIDDVRDVHAALEVKLDLDGRHQEGGLEVWYAKPDRFRQEMTFANATTTKILAGESAWVVDASRRVARQNGTPDGERAIEQMRQDRERIADLAKMLTLNALKGPDVGFELLGATVGTDTFAGRWLKVVRRQPSRPDMTFWFAYTEDEHGVRHAISPGVVRVAGEPDKRIATEDYVLRDWAAAPNGLVRYPRTIEAFRSEPGNAGTRFLKALVRALDVNAGIDPAKFQPP